MLWLGIAEICKSIANLTISIKETANKKGKEVKAGGLVWLSSVTEAFDGHLTLPIGRKIEYSNLKRVERPIVYIIMKIQQCLNNSSQTHSVALAPLAKYFRKH